MSLTNFERVLTFDSNKGLTQLYGHQDQHLRRLEQVLQIIIASRGNKVVIKGAEANVALAYAALTALHNRLERGLEVDLAEVDAAIRLIKAQQGEASTTPSSLFSEGHQIVTRKKIITPRTPGQKDYIEALQKYDLTFGVGPAGTGKTYLAVAAGVSALLSGRVERIILSRPAVEAGEKLGFLPGDLKEKIDPYLRPLYDALYDMLPGEQVARRLLSNDIEIAPLAYMRGRTLSHAFIILDEAQNTTSVQMKMFLTRLGEGSIMAINGDPSQIDLPPGQTSGLVEALRKLQNIPEIHVTQFTAQDVVRHALVSKIILAYDAPSPSPSH